MIDLVPRRVIDLQGLRLELRYTLAAVHRFEQLFGRGVRVGDDGCITMHEFRALIWCMSDGSYNQQAIGRRITVSNLAEILNSVVALIAQSSERVTGLGESETPAEPTRIDWVDLWTVARVDMRLTDAEFWSLTPHMYQRLLLRVRRKYGMPDELSRQEQADVILRKIEMLNIAMGGKDLRGVK